MKGICEKCGRIVELVEDITVCQPCLDQAIADVMEKLGQPMILDEEDGCVYMPKGILN